MTGRLVEADLAQLARSLRRCTVVVIGDVMLDRYVTGDAERLSPEAPIPVLNVTDEQTLLGGAANVAMKVVELGAKVRIVGLIGEDSAGSEVRALLEASGIDTTHLVVHPTRPTTVKTRLVARNQQLMRIDREQRVAVEGESALALARAARAVVDSCDVLVLEDYGKGALTREVIRAALEGAADCGAPVVVDPHGTDYSRYAGATVLTPNTREAELASGAPIGSEAELAAAGATLTRQTGGAALAITREGKGISLFRRDGDDVHHVHLPTRPVAVYDVTGAGDADRIGTPFVSMSVRTMTVPFQPDSLATRG